MSTAIVSAVNVVVAAVGLSATIVSTVIVIVTTVLVQVAIKDIVTAVDAAATIIVINAERSLQRPCDDNLKMHSRPNFMHLLQHD